MEREDVVEPAQPIVQFCSTINNDNEKILQTYRENVLAVTANWWSFCISEGKLLLQHFNKKYTTCWKSENM